jgi:DNA helicase-2/ATP-dependent DNA helicase PcrA
MSVMEQVWSSYQEAIFTAIETTNDSLVIEAVAGSGKTSTLVECARRLTEFDSAIAIAFNKRIADELARRLPPFVPALTLNALGFRAWKAFTGKSMEVDGLKVTKLVKALSNAGSEARKGIKRLIDLAKMAGIVPTYVKIAGLKPDTDQVWYDLIAEYGVVFDELPNDEAIEIARKVLTESVRMGADRIDFNDQMYLPVVFGADFPKYDTLFVDEAQDVSEIQRVMIERSVSKRGRVIAFGDGSQALYHFRGAGANSLPLLKERFNARSLPLSISYRCSRAVIREAQKYVPGIEAWEGATEGKAAALGNLAWDESTFFSDDVILCRNNAPLVSMAFRLIRAGKPCKVLGRDIGAGLVALVQKMRASTVAELKEKLNRYQKEEMTKLDENQIDAFLDRMDTLRIFIENATTIAVMIQRIEALFGDDIVGLTLSTVHKAKGLEWSRVFILNRELIGMRAKQAWEKQAENNIAYVAITRAKEELYFIRS